MSFKYYNWFTKIMKKAQILQGQQLQNAYQKVINSPSTSIQIEDHGGMNETLQLAGKSITARQLMNKIMPKIEGELRKKNINKIIVDPSISAFGLNESNAPGSIKINLKKHFEQARNHLPSTAQLDGVVVDSDASNKVVNTIAQQIIDTLFHESSHEHDFQKQFAQNKPFQSSQGPAQQLGAQMARQFQSQNFN